MEIKVESKKLILHIGTHKTGTTAIQKSLKGYKNPEIREITHPELFRKISKIKKSSQQKEINQLTSELDKLFSKETTNTEANTFIISFEGFSGNTLSAYANAPVIAKIIKTAAQKTFCNIKVLIYLRRQDDFIESLYTQYIHQGQSWSFEEFNNKFNERSFDWYELCSSYDNEFGEENVIVRPYEKSKLKNNDLISDFNEISGLELKPHSEKKINLGYSRNALEIAKICNSEFTSEEKKRLRALLQKTNTKKPFDSYTYLSKKERYALLEKHANSNSRIAKRIGSDELFSYPVEPLEQNKNSQLTIENITTTIMRALINQQ